MKKLLTASLLALVLSSITISAYALSVDETYQLAKKAIAGDSVAFNALKNAADQGDAGAQFNLGVMYAKGQGVAQDYAQAVAWFRKVADQGNAGAQFNLGFMYANGQGVAQDYAQAVSWYRKAADQGNAGAQFNLGFMYAKGQGVAQDAMIAYALYNLSASNDQSQDNHATSNRQIISEHMTEYQIEEGQALTRRMKSEGVLKAIDHTPSHNLNHTHKKTEPLSSRKSQNDMWSARPTKTPG